MPFPITNQADLYYRNQTPNPGANSGNRVYPSEGRFAAQPYIIRDIGQRWGFGLGFDDGLVRGGVVTLADRAVNDVVRLTKFSLDLPKGPLFLVKQFGLQLMNPRFFLKEESVPTPAPRNNRSFDSSFDRNFNREFRNNTSQDSSNDKESTLRLGFSDTQLYNPLSTVIQAGLTPLGLHFQRHSLPYVFPKYEESAKLSNEGINPGQVGARYNISTISGSFTSYEYDIETENRPLNDDKKSKLVNLYVNNILYEKGYQNNAALIEYPTGPGSMLGIGSTIIKRYDNTRLGVMQFINEMVDKSKLIQIGYFNNEYNINDTQSRIKTQNSVYNTDDINEYSAKINREEQFDLLTTSSLLTYPINTKFITVENFLKNSSPLNIEGISFYATEDEKNKTGVIETRITTKDLAGYFSTSSLSNNITSSKNIELNSFGTKSPVLNIASSSLGSNFNQDEIEKTGDIRSRITLKPSILSSSLNTRFGTNAFTYDQITSYTSDLETPGNRSTNNTTYRDFRQSTTGLAGKIESDNYSKFNIHKRIGVMDTGLPLDQRFDIINTQDIGGSIPRDLVKFAFEAIDNKGNGATDVIAFRAYIKSFSDDYGAKWNSVDYMGRGEKFYTYEGFERKIKVGFTIFAHSVKEMKPLYRKLLYLFSQTAPDYSTAGYMKGPFVKLTIGNWFYKLPGFINSISTTVDGKETPWEITLNSPENGSDTGMLELPKLLEIDIDFTPIHNFTPKKGTPESLTKFLNLGSWTTKGSGSSPSTNTGGTTTEGSTTVTQTNENGVTTNNQTATTRE